MAGFFKKLFNRITGRKEDEVPPPVEQAALPAPVLEPEPSVEDVPPPVAVPQPVAKKTVPPPVLREPEPKVKLPAPKLVAKPAVKKPKAPESPKPVAKKAEPKKVEAKKSEPKKPEPKKPDAKKPEPKKSGAPKTAAKVPVAPKVEKTPVKLPTAEPAALKKAAEVEISEPRPALKPVRVEVKPVEPPRPAPPLPASVVELPLPAPVARPAFKPAPKPAPAPPPAIPEKKGWLSRLKDGLSKSSMSITGSITAIFTKRKLDATTLQELEDTLIQADLGITVAERIIKAVSTGRYDKEIDPEEVKQILAAEVAKVLKPVEVPFNFGTEKPYVILVVGVNGSGKTTTIGKLGAIATAEDFKVKFAACDTFRAAAIEQLTVWGQRIGAETISAPPGADAAGLAYDAMKAAQADGTDILFVDTAGRLHNKVYLMDELDKVVRVIKKYDANAPHAVLLVLDATTGQNALAQAEAFTKVAGVTGLIMTKLDGTARGGILVAIAETFKLPIHAIGVGETLDDLQPFDAEAFARTIAGLEGQ